MSKRRVQAQVISETPFKTPSTQVNPLAAIALINALGSCPTGSPLGFPATAGFPVTAGFPFINPALGFNSPLAGFGASPFVALPTPTSPFGSSFL